MPQDLKASTYLESPRLDEQRRQPVTRQSPAPLTRRCTDLLTATPDRRKIRIDSMLDLQEVPAAERWDRIARAVQQLDRERGCDWRLKLLIGDTPEEATGLPRLVARLGSAGLRHDASREPGGIQGIVVAPRTLHREPVAA